MVNTGTHTEGIILEFLNHLLFLGLYDYSSHKLNHIYEKSMAVWHRSALHSVDVVDANVLIHDALLLHFPVV